jgi:cytoskeletal protein CcmA (bactofilin family)
MGRIRNLFALLISRLFKDQAQYRTRATKWISQMAQRQTETPYFESAMRNKEREMFGKSKDENDRVPPPVQQLQRPAAMHSGGQVPTDEASSISRGMTVVGKISGEGTVQVFGHIEGELRALTVLINEGAQVEGDVVAEELTIAGQVKGTIHANRVKLNSTAVVEGDIFHRSLSIEENARFEGSSKREDSAVDVPRTPLRRPATQDDLQIEVTAIEGNRKSPAYDGHFNAGASSEIPGL